MTHCLPVKLYPQHLSRQEKNHVSAVQVATIMPAAGI
jgi:hypothetical protein